MKKLNINENETEPVTNIGEIKTYQHLVPGGYVCEITKVEDVPLNPLTNKGDYLKINFDISEGDFKGYYKDMESRVHFYAGNFVRSYKPTAIQMFADFIRTVKASNPGFSWDFTAENDEHSLEGCTIGLVLQDEEYLGRDGSTKHRMRVAAVKTADDIRSGNFTTPEPKTLPKPEVVQVVDVTAAADKTEDDDDIFAV